MSQDCVAVIGVGRERERRREFLAFEQSSEPRSLFGFVPRPSRLLWPDTSIPTERSEERGDGLFRALIERESPIHHADVRFIRDAEQERRDEDEAVVMLALVHRPKHRQEIVGSGPNLIAACDPRQTQIFSPSFAGILLGRFFGLLREHREEYTSSLMPVV